MKMKWIFKVVALGALGVLVLGWVTTLLWNNLMPLLFHLPIITYWQAVGMMLLFRLLFGGFKHGRPGGCGCGGNRWRGAWAGRWEAKLANMSPEEREKIKSEWKNKCHSWKNWDDNSSQPTN